MAPKGGIVRKVTFFKSPPVKAGTANRMLKRRLCILGAHQKASLGLKDKGQPKQQRKLSCSLLYLVCASGWDMGEKGAWKMKLFHTAQAFGLPEVHTLDYGEYTSWL